MKTHIHFDKMHFYAFHGVDPQETKVGNHFAVELRLEIPFHNAMHSDALEETVNYATIYEVVETVMATPSRLLEHVAGRTIAALQARFPNIASGRIAIYKETPPITGNIDRVGVIVEW